MSFVSGLFNCLLAFPTAFKAYKQAHFEFSTPFCKADPRRAEMLSYLPGNQIKTAMQPFLDKSGIRKDVIFIETITLKILCAVGTNMFRRGDAVVYVSAGLYELDENLSRWAIKHEIGHIKHNDLFTMYCVPCVCQLAASIFGTRSLSFLPALGLAFTVGIASRILFSQWREAKTDDFAIENSSDEELTGGIRFLTMTREINLAMRNTFKNRVVISASGDMRFDFLHPSTISRIQKIKRTLHARNVEIDLEAETKRVKTDIVDKLTIFPLQQSLMKAIGDQLQLLLPWA
jgi:hypothetical protein